MHQAGTPLNRHYADCYVAPWLIRPLHPCWESILKQGIPRLWPKKTMLLHIGRQSHDIILVQKGLLSLIAIGSQGEQRTIGILGSGSLLGEASLFCGLNHSHMVYVVEACEGIIFSKQTLLHDIMTRPELAQTVCENLAMKSYIMSTQLELQFFMNSEQRIAHFLYHLSVEQQQNSTSWQQLSHLSLTSLGELLGMHRVTVTNIVNAFRRSGILRADTQQLEVEDMDALLRLLKHT